MDHYQEPTGSNIRRARSCISERGHHRLKIKKSDSVKYFISDLPKSILKSASFSPIRKSPGSALIADRINIRNGTDLEDVKVSSGPALLNESSGNFGSAGARSAPSTPQGILGASPGGLCEPGCPVTSIQRSPSHSVFTKCDKASLKYLSTSTPAMTAQAQLPEPPSPKTVKDVKTPTTSKARQKKFNRHFPSIDSDEKVLNHYSCALIGDILLQGHLYITKDHFGFYSNVFGYVTKLLIPVLSVEKITKEKTARIIPNAVGIATSEDKHVFGSLMSRDNTFRYMTKVWELAQSASVLVVEPEIVEPVPVSDSDSSETKGPSGRESPIAPPPPAPPPPPSATHHVIDDDANKDDIVPETTTELAEVLKQSISKVYTLPKQSLILFATTLLLILLFLSAAILLYRISKIQDRYSFFLQDNIESAGSEDIYNNLLQWQTKLHTKSAGAVHSFLDSNLDQIAKVRQSLEALSTLLISNGHGHDANKQDSS